MLVVCEAMCAMSTAGADEAMDGMLWCSEYQTRSYPSSSDFCASATESCSPSPTVCPGRTVAKSMTDRGRARKSEAGIPRATRPTGPLFLSRPAATRHTWGMSATPETTSPADPSATVARLVSLLRESSPLVHCLTNSVVREVTADVLLAAGAAPAMVDHPAEAGDFAAVASGVLINVGNPTSEQIEGMQVAIVSAREHGTPWVLDPVAVGGLKLRTELATAWLGHGPAAIRANASEIVALSGAGEGGRGVDSTATVSSALLPAIELSGRTGGTVAISGEKDLIITQASGPTRATWVASGHPLLQKVIGTGCALGALTAGYISVARAAGISDHDAVVAAHAHVGAAGSAAGRVAMGPGSFAMAWMDALYSLQPEQVAELAVLTIADTE